jgi:protease PrsW
MNYLALAVAPGIAIIIFILYKDRYNKEPRMNLIVSFILGCISIIPAAAIEHEFRGITDGSVTALAIFCFVIVAGSEEMVKFLCLRLYSYNMRSFDEPLDGIVYSLMVSMGFATVENYLYVIQYAEVGRGVQVGIQRMFMSVPAHAAFAVLMGYYVGKAKFSRNGFLLVIWGLILAIFFHGAYDFFLFYKTMTYYGANTDALLLIGGAILTLIIGVIISFAFIRRHRKLSQQTFLQQQQLLLQQQREQQNTTFSA